MHGVPSFAQASERQAQGVLPACRGVTSGHHAKLIEDIEAAGAKVTISKLDVVDPEQAKQLVALAESIAPVAAIFHLAMVLDDRMLINQVLHPLHASQIFICHSFHAMSSMPPDPFDDVLHPEWAWPHTRILLTESLLCCARPVRAGTGA